MIIAVAVRVGRGELHEAVAADLDAGKAVRLSAEGVRVLDRDTAGRKGRRLLVGTGGRVQVPIAGQAVGFGLHGVPVDAAFRPCHRVVFREIALVQDFASDSGRELEILGYDGILPGDGVLRQLGIVIVVSFLDDAVIDGMVRQLQSLRQQAHVLFLVLGQETDIQVRRLDGDSSRAGRIQERHGRLHVLHGIRILQFLAQLDHSVGQGGNIHPAFVGPGQPLLVTPRQEHQRQQHFPTVSHSTYLSSDAKLGNGAVLKKY